MVNRTLPGSWILHLEIGVLLVMKTSTLVMLYSTLSKYICNVRTESLGCFSQMCPRYHCHVLYANHKCKGKCKERSAIIHGSRLTHIHVMTLMSV